MPPRVILPLTVMLLSFGLTTLPAISWVTLTRDVHYNAKGKGDDSHRYQGNGALVCVDPTGNVTETHIRWLQRDLNRTFGTPSISDEGLLFVADRAGWLSCFDIQKQGERL